MIHVRDRADEGVVAVVTTSARRARKLAAPPVEDFFARDVVVRWCRDATVPADWPEGLPFDRYPIRGAELDRVLRDGHFWAEDLFCGCRSCDLDRFDTVPESRVCYHCEECAECQPRTPVDADECDRCRAEAALAAMGSA